MILLQISFLTMEDLKHLSTGQMILSWTTLKVIVIMQTSLAVKSTNVRDVEKFTNTEEDCGLIQNLSVEYHHSSSVSIVKNISTERM